MSNKILVTYATKAGSTTGVAEAIAQTLADSGAQVDIIPMQEVQELTPYRAVVAGSAIRGDAWLPEAMQFVETHQNELNQKPFAMFMVCMALSMSNTDKHRTGIKAWLDPVRSLVRPVSEGYFAGGLDFRKLPRTRQTLMLRLPVILRVWSEGDHRDWDAIHTWANDLPALLEG
ncbi:flavodoxin domain-containing protein [Chloroflexota bacterium]